MAVTAYGTNHPLAVKTWERGLTAEWLKALRIAPLIGADKNSIIQLKDISTKGAGDRITFGLKYQLTGRGVTEGITLEGNEEALQTGNAALSINELAHAVRVKAEDTIEQQRVLFNLRQEAKESIVDWYATRMAATFFIHACGYTGRNMTLIGRPISNLGPLYWGFNEVQAPSENRWIIAGGKATEAELEEGDGFNLQYIDHMVEWARLANPMIRPVRVDGDEWYVLYMHPSQVTQLRTNTDSGQWLDITKSNYRGTRENNPIVKGSLGRYNNVVLRSDEFVTAGLNADGTENTNVRRAVLLGAQSLVMGFGRNFGPNRFRTDEEYFDYKRELGVAVRTVFGMKKTRYSFCGNEAAEDYGTIVLSTFSPKSSGRITPPSGGGGGVTNVAANDGLTGSIAGDTLTIGIANAGIQGAKIANSAINTARLADKAVNTAKLDDATVTGAKIAANTIAIGNMAGDGKSSNTYYRGDGQWQTPSGGTPAADSITTEMLKDGAVTNAKIGDVAAGKISGTITTAQIGDKQVTGAKIADKGVASGQLADAVNASLTKADNAVPTSRKINTTAPLGGGGDLTADRTITYTAGQSDSKK